MFHSARLTLTAWYLLIIMAISIAFSVVIFFGATQEFNRVIRLQQYRQEHPEFHVRLFPGNQVQIEPAPQTTAPDTEVIEAAKFRVLINLAGINVIILLLSAFAGYFLAGRTLRPIADMVDEQNRFITDASHELNTPLTSLRTSIEVSLRDKKFTMSKAKQLLKSNLEEVENLALLSDELISLAQYEKKTVHVVFSSVFLENIVKKAFEKVKILADQKEIVFSIDVANIEIAGEEKMLTELFVILFDNAIKYSNNKAQVSIITEKTEKGVKLLIKDIGIGIAKEDVPHVFDRFFRSDKSRTKQKINGYGLGLSIAKRIVLLHHGTISVESTLGKGTTFTVFLPGGRS